MVFELAPKTAVLLALTNAPRGRSKGRTSDVSYPPMPQVDGVLRSHWEQVKPIYAHYLCRSLSMRYGQLFAQCLNCESIRESIAYRVPSPFVVQFAKGLPESDFVAAQN